MKQYIKYLCAALLTFISCVSAWGTDCTYYVWDDIADDWAVYTVQDENEEVVPGPDMSDEGFYFFGWHMYSDPATWPRGGGGYITAESGATKYIRFVPKAGSSSDVKNTGKEDEDHKLYAIYTNDFATNWVGSSGWSTETSSRVTITYDSNGGTGTMSTQSVLQGVKTYLRPCTFTPPSGKYFAGWATSSSGYAVYKEYETTIGTTSSTVVSGPGVFNSNTTLYAVWVDDTKAAVIYELEGLEHDGSNPKTITIGNSLNAHFTYASGYTSPVTGYVKVGDWYTYTLGTDLEVEYYAGTLACTGTIEAGDVIIVHLSATEISCTQYNIDINVSSGSGNTYVTPKACEDETITFTANPSTGYQYAGATVVGYTISDIELNSSTKSFTMPGEDVEINVNFSPRTYDVTLNPNGGSGSNQTVTATYDAAMPLTLKGSGAIVIPTKTGYHFGGYYDTNSSSGGTQYYRYISALASEHNWDKANTATLYARWTPNATTITLDKNGGSTNGGALVDYDGNEPLIDSHATAATGYQLDGYYTNDASPVKVLNADGSFAATNVTGYITDGKWSNTSNEITLYAHWEPISYSITYNNMSGATNHASNPSSYTIVSSAITLNEPTKTGYDFGGWFTDADLAVGHAVSSTAIASGSTGDKVFYAKWTAKVIALTLDDNGGTGDGSGSVTFNGASATISSAPVNGTKLIKGYYAAADGDKKVLNDDGTFAAAEVTDFIEGGQWKVATATTLYAHWITDNKIVTFNLHGHGGDNFTQNVENGQKADRPAAPTDVDYNFAGWYTDDAGEASSTEFDFENTVITDATTIHAKWTAKSYSKLIFACVDISVANHGDGKALVTSRNGVNIMASTPIKVTVEGAISGHVVDFSSTDGLKFYKKVDGAYKDLSVAANKLTAPLDGQEVYVSYNPTASGDGAISNPTFTISCDGERQEFNSGGEYVRARNLPDAVAITTKIGGSWHALSANIATSSTPKDEMIYTAEDGGVLKAYGNVTELGYKLWPVKTTAGSADRFGTGSGGTIAFGDRLRFAGKDDKGLTANNNSSSNKYNINNYAVIDAVDDDPAEAYEWKVTTTEEDGQFVYTLQTDQTNNNRFLQLWNGRWGTYLDNKGIKDLYILPVETANLVETEVYEWGANDVVIAYTPSATPVALTQVTIGSDAPITTPTASLTNIGGDLWKISGLSSLDTKPAQQFVVQLTENGASKQALLQVPFIVTSEKTEQNLRTSVSNDPKIYNNVDVVIRNGGTLTTGYDLGNFANLYVYPGGKAVISNNMTFNNIYLRGGYSFLATRTYDYPDLCIKSGTITADSVIYDLHVDNRYYYIFSMPYDVPLVKVTDEKGYDDFPVWVKHYNGAKRASGHKVDGWEWYGDLPSQHSFFAGVGYEITAKPRVSGRPLAVIRFPIITSGSVESDESNTAGVSVGNWGYSAYEAGTQSANNVGWNLLGTPYTTAFKAVSDTGMIVKAEFEEHLVNGVWDGTYDWKETPARFITVPYDQATDYHHELVKGYSIPAFSGFFIQTTTSGTFTIAGNRPLAAAPARFGAAPKVQPEIALDLMLRGEKEGVVGKAGMVIHERYEGCLKDFEDVEQWFVEQNLLKTYTFADGTAVAYNLLNEDAAEMWTPMGYIATTAGELTYALNEDNDVSGVEHVWLADYMTGAITDLLVNSYTFESSGGRDDNRFAVSISFRHDEVATGVDNLDGGWQKTIGIYSEGYTMTLRGLPENSTAYVYDMSGKLVARGVGLSNVTSFTVGTQGVYNVRVVNGGEAVTLRTVIR